MKKLESPELKAAVTYKKENITGAIPIFRAQNQLNAEEIAERLGKILQGVVHYIGNGIYIIVKH